MMSDKDNNLLKSDILTVGSELSEKLNAIGVPNTFGKASEGKDNLTSIIRMTISGLDMTIEQIREILRDYYNKSEVNTLLNGKSDTSHNHDSAYANISHNHDNLYASKNELKGYYNTSEVNTLLNGKSDTSHNHDSAYASKSHQHDGADVILSNNNDVGTEIGNIEDDITSINGDITSLNTRIANLVQIQYIEVATSSTLKANGGTGTATVTVTPLPTGYRRLLFERKGANGRIFDDKLNGSTLTLTAQNLRTSEQKVFMRCYLIYVPTSWSYVDHIKE